MEHVKSPAMGPPLPALPPRTGRLHAPGHVPLSDDPIHHLLRRVTFGVTPQLLAEVKHQGVTTWLNHQLNPQSVRDSACSHALKRFDLLNRNSLQLYRVLKARDKEYSWDAMEQVSQATLMRAVMSKRQLFEVMVDFWNNHFNVTCPSDKVWQVRAMHDNVVIRRHALGRFEDMLIASTKSPAMLLYLDNASSTGDNPNENLGRELLELHTVGLGYYTEHDMHQSALALTGLSVQDDDSSFFDYKPGNRYVGKLKVMGWHSANSSPTAGEAVATSYLKYLAHHPATAYRIAHKLAVRFVSDKPPTSLVNRMAGAYVQYDTAIVPMLKVLFSSHEFWTSLGQKVRRPYEWAVATMRTLGYTAVNDGNTDDWAGLIYQCNDLGMAPLAWDPPNGYPDTQAAWESTSTTLGQWRAAVALVQGWSADGKKGVRKLDVNLGFAGVSGNPTAGQLVDALSLRLIGQKLAPPHRKAIFHYYGVADHEHPEDWQLDHNQVEVLAFLILSSPVWSLR
ncbi:MAG TPA: DUF1800 domain-containing protein [Mycobacteriales bacterium]|nr:DUF1800 domain-containing protein [Mycobacteriales bacterium]